MVDPFVQSRQLFDIKAVHFDQFPKQLPVWVAMCLVMSLAASLDISAIEMELGYPLDYNK